MSVEPEMGGVQILALLQLPLGLHNRLRLLVFLRHELTCGEVFGVCMHRVSKPYRQLVCFWQSTALQRVRGRRRKHGVLKVHCVALAGGEFRGVG